MSLIKTKIPKIGEIYVVKHDDVSSYIVLKTNSFIDQSEISYLSFKKLLAKGESVLFLQILKESNLIPLTIQDNILFKFWHIQHNNIFYLKMCPLISKGQKWETLAYHKFWWLFSSFEENKHNQ